MESTQCLSFCDWLVSLSIVSSWFIHIVVRDRISFLLKGYVIFLCVAISPCAYPIIPKWTVGLPTFCSCERCCCEQCANICSSLSSSPTQCYPHLPATLFCWLKQVIGLDSIHRTGTPQGHDPVGATKVTVHRSHSGKSSLRKRPGGCTHTDPPVAWLCSQMPPDRPGIGRGGSVGDAPVRPRLSPPSRRLQCSPPALCR